MDHVLHAFFHRFFGLKQNIVRCHRGTTVQSFEFRVSGTEFRSFLSSLFNPELETRNPKRETAIHSEVTKVPTFSPQTTFLILCGLLMSKTIIGTRLSMQRLKAVESITRSLFVNASVKETVSYRCAF